MPQLVLTPREVLKATITEHEARIAVLRVLIQERREMVDFASELEWDAKEELKAEQAALADAYDALADVKRSDRRIAS